MAWWDLGGKDWLKGKPYSGGSPTNYYNSEDIQKFLPVGLRDASGFLNTRQGLANLSKLFTNPGSFTGNISEAIAPRVAMEHESIGRATAGGMAEASARSARAGTSGTGISQALQAAIQQSGEREKATSVRTAQMDSAKLQREDLSKLFDMYNLLLQFSEQARKYNQKQKDAYIEAVNKRASGFLSMGSAVTGAFS